MGCGLVTLKTINVGTNNEMRELNRLPRDIEKNKTLPFHFPL